MATTTKPRSFGSEMLRVGHSPMKPGRSYLGMEDRSPRALDAFVKLNPRKMMGNPVMFVVEIGSVITTVLLVRGGAASSSTCRSRCGCGSPCCSPTLPKPWPKAAARHRPTRCARRVGDDREPHARATARSRESRAPSCAPAISSRLGRRVHSLGRRDHRRRRVGRRVGHHRRIGSRDSRSRRRPLGGDRRHARALRPDQGEDHVQPGRDLPRSHDRAGRRRGAAEDTERDRAEHSAGRADDHLSAGGGHAAALRDLLRLAADGVRAGLAAGLPDSDDDRRLALGDRHRRHGPPGAAQRAGHVWPRGGSCGRRQHAAARQDRHDHAGQSPGLASSFPLPASPKQELADAAQLSSLADETPEGRSIVVLAKEKYGLRGRELGSA